MRKKVLWALGLVALALVLVSCAPDATQNSLKPEGPYAQKIQNLFVPVFWIAVAVFVLVEGGIVFIALKWRHRKGRDRTPPQTHGNTRLEIGWTIAPALVLAVVMVPTIATIWDLAKPPPANALNITVEGHQWWWGFSYTDADMKTTYGTNAPITTGDVMVIPTGRTVYLSLESKGGALSGGVPPPNADFMVIHSFWVPQLAGKQDVFPGRTNHILLQADHYIAVLEIKNGRAHFYDPRFNLDEWKTLPKEDDPKFRAQVLAFEVPSSDLNAEIGKTKTTDKPLPGGVPTK